MDSAGRQHAGRRAEAVQRNPPRARQHLAADADVDLAGAGAGRAAHAHGLPDYSSARRIQADQARTFPARPGQPARAVGTPEPRGHPGGATAVRRRRGSKLKSHKLQLFEGRSTDRCFDPQSRLIERDVLTLWWGWSMRLFDYLDLLPDEYRGHAVSGLIGAVGAVIAAIVGAVVGILFKAWLERKRRTQLEKVVDTQQRKLDGLLERVRSSDEITVWTAFEEKLPPDYKKLIDERAFSLPIITVANLKGGVGKTTVTANLAAYLDRALGKRVLMIDFDYQGSLTTMLRPYLQRRDRVSLAKRLLSGDADLGTLLSVAAPLGPELNRSCLIPAFYELARFEDRVLIEWLLQEVDDDVRYRLARLLLIPELKDRFDVVLIDAPPRLTTGTINALCASTHLLIPTVFNPVSAEPVEYFLRLLKQSLLQRLSIRVDVVGVLETLTPRVGEAKDEREEARQRIEKALKNWFSKSKILNADIPRRSAIAQEGVAYVHNAAMRVFFERLGLELVENRVIPLEMREAAE